MDVTSLHDPTSDEAGCVCSQAPTSPGTSGASPTVQEPSAPPGMEPSQLTTSRLSQPTLLLRAGSPGCPSARALPCSGKVGAGLAVQSAAVTSTAQNRRHFQLHIPVLQLEVGDKAPHLHGDSAVGLILLCKLTLGREKIPQS